MSGHHAEIKAPGGKLVVADVTTDAERITAATISGDFFLEPEEAFELETHVVNLTENTIEANARFFASKDEVPRKAITMGIKSIMQARHILVVVSGADKADIVKAAFTGPVTPKVPASILQMHPNVSLVGDAAALSKL